MVLTLGLCVVGGHVAALQTQPNKSKNTAVVKGRMGKVAGYDGAGLRIILHPGVAKGTDRVLQQGVEQCH